MGGTPKSSILVGFSLTKTIQLLGYPHDELETPICYSQRFSIFSSILESSCPSMTPQKTPDGSYVVVFCSMFGEDLISGKGRLGCERNPSEKKLFPNQPSCMFFATSKTIETPWKTMCSKPFCMFPLSLVFKHHWKLHKICMRFRMPWAALEVWEMTWACHKKKTVLYFPIS